MSRLNIGSIDENSRVWLDAQVIKIDENYSADKSTAGGVPEIGISTGSSHPKDYMMMTYEQRSIDIDQLQAPASHVITGVRFRNLGGHLNLEARVTTLFNFFIRNKAKLLRCGQTPQRVHLCLLILKVTPIKFRDGKLSPDNSIWISNDNTPATTNRRQPFFLLSPDIPTRFQGNSLIDTTTNQYLAFDSTSPEKDVG